MKRIVVIGNGGAGKSTFSRKLAEIMGIPLYHLDAYFWNPGWVSTKRPEWQAFLTDLLQRDAWIIDGNYSSTLDLRLQYADTVIFLDMPAPRCLLRVVKRRWMYRGKTRPDMREGCPEKLDAEFVRFVWGYDRRERPGVLRKLAALPADKAVVILRGSRAAARYLEEVRAAGK